MAANLGGRTAGSSCCLQSGWLCCGGWRLSAPARVDSMNPVTNELFKWRCENTYARLDACFWPRESRPLERGGCSAVTSCAAGSKPASMRSKSASAMLCSLERYAEL